MSQSIIPGLERTEPEKLLSESDELYTPQWFIDALGEIHLDPCANYTRQFATHNWTQDDDGLARDWEGDLVFVNPPYSNPLQERFVRHAHAQVGECRIGYLVMLIQARVETRYWHEAVWPLASCVMFPQGRIAFVDRNGLGDVGGSFASAVVIARRPGGCLVREAELERSIILACEQAGHPVKCLRP